MKTITSLDKLSNDLKHKIKDVLDVISERENLTFLDKSKRIYIGCWDVQAKMTSETFASILDALTHTFEVIKVTEEYEPALTKMAFKLNALVSNFGKSLPAEYSSIVNKIFYIELTERFTTFYHSLSCCSDSQKAVVVDNVLTSVLSDNKIFWISYSEKGRKIFLNNADASTLISKPDFDSINEQIFTFIYNNDNKKITLEELKKGCKIKINKSLHKVLNELGFKGKLKELFFDVSSKGIIFHNPITEQDLIKRNLKQITLSDLIHSNLK